MRTKFTKLKSEVKKKLEIREQNKTGGGPEIKFNYTPFEEKVLQMIGKKYIYFLCCQYLLFCVFVTGYFWQDISLAVIVYCYFFKVNIKSSFHPLTMCVNVDFY